MSGGDAIRALTFEEWWEQDGQKYYGLKDLAACAWRTRDAEIAAVEREMEELRAPGPCGKHPLVCYDYSKCHHCCQFQETNGKMPHDCTPVCTACEALAASEAAAYREAANEVRQYRLTDKASSSELGKDINDFMESLQADILAKITPDQAATLEKVIQSATAPLQSKLDEVRKLAERLKSEGEDLKSAKSIADSIEAILDRQDKDPCAAL